MSNVECRMNRCHSERSRLPRRSFMRRREESRCGSLKIIPRDPSTSLRMTALVFIGLTRPNLLGLVIGMETKLTWYGQSSLRDGPPIFSRELKQRNAKAEMRAMKVGETISI